MRGLCKDDHVVLAGEITSAARVNVEAVAREAIKEIGYKRPRPTLQRYRRIGSEFIQPPGRADIACGVDNGNDLGADGQLYRPERR